MIEAKTTLYKGMAVYACDHFKNGGRIASFEGYVVDECTKYSLYLEGNHIEPTGELKYLNHSCSPNAHFNGRWLFAKRDIVKGEEITVDYTETEPAISHPFECKCGMPVCRKVVGTVNETDQRLIYMPDVKI